ncbi:hypothetical protein KSS87_006058 [Heliosperma pusillum]|nr:hypothetical protein KSS87_006058 [Heliosperma pusillum]
MQLNESEGIQGKTFVVTGGQGYVGAALCLELIRRGARHVKTLDLRASSPWSSSLHHAGVISILGDITREKDVKKALRGADCVFHVASFGMSGKEMLQAGRIDAININGTCLVLDTCVDFGIKRLVYVSTSNVVFGGKEIVNGNESLPYLPLDEYTDPYSRSKAIAEQLVLKYNGRPFRDKNGGCLYTCAIRSAGIYGPAEDRHFPRIVFFAKLGLLFNIGGLTVKNDWVYLDNLVLSLLLASMGLLDDIPGREGRPVAAGQAYFISDGTPVNSFEFVRLLLTSLDYSYSRFSLSLPTALKVGQMFWGFYTLLFPWLNKKWLPQPLLLPAEVYKVGVTNYFSVLKARQELGYVPIVSSQEGMAATISYWQDRKRKSLDGPTVYAWCFVLLGMFLIFAIAFLPDVTLLSPVKVLSLFLFRSVRGIQIVFILAVLAHALEAVYAWHLAKKVDPGNARGWFWQTFALGFFSLRFLLKRARAHA